MDHTAHIEKHKIALTARFDIIRSVREFFWSENFLEVEAPAILRLPGQEPYLSPMTIVVHNEKQEPVSAYLHTSPEYAMKKMLAAGFEKIFFLGKTFRDYESFGGLHNPEFTMLEWYRSGGTMWNLMDDVERLIGGLVTRYPLLSPTFTRQHMRDVWQEYAHVALDDYLSVEAMYELCVQKGYAPDKDEPYEDLFYRIFLNEIEPNLSGITMIHHYPAQMAALAKISESDSRYAERVEVYVDGVELANGFTELTDADEQLRRLQTEQVQRVALGKPVFDIDMDFIAAVGRMPPSAGMALGIDRLIQILLDISDIDSVLPIPASVLFD